MLTAAALAVVAVNPSAALSRLPGGLGAAHGRRPEPAALPERPSTREGKARRARPVEGPAHGFR
ncbi:hypothetical protein ACIG0B_05475, partial [Streptomyces althioticus]